jgi:hypothetical protein
MAVTTVALIKACGQVGSEVDDADALLLNVLSAAERMAEEYCGYRFGSEDSAIEYFDQNLGQRRINLNRVNIASSPAIDVRYDSAWIWGTGNKLESTGYILNSADGILTLQSDYPPNLRAWKISYKATGWDSTSAPMSLVWAVTNLAAYLYGKSKSGNVGQKNDAIGQSQSNNFETIIPKDIRAILDLHRRWVVAL